MADKRIGFNLDFKANTKDVESNLNKLKQSLKKLQEIKLVDFKGNNKQLKEMQEKAQAVEKALTKAFNPTLNTVNIKAFQSQVEKTAGSIDQIYTSFSKAGAQGQVAFHQMSTQILTTNLQLKETHSLIDSMGKTMMNTVKWGIASSVMNTFTQSVQGAFSYVQSLQKSLTNIRIVTGDNIQQMAKFADQANRAAQGLGRSTLDYTKSSLTFYQQGLDDETVQARTEATLKAQNITGTGAQMADYLTSVWNGYKVANEQAQLYVDKLAAVADSSASDMSQLAIAMSKVSATANVLGVDVDQLAASIATVVATTRLAPESVGTAFKTIFARINDIKTGSDQAEISLGNYSGKMASLGINVLDATGHLRDTGEVMDEIGQKWATMTREQQIYLAQTMGGQRQITQVTALFDNWALYSELLNTSLQSQGTLNEKNARYMESLGAKMEQLGAAGERVKAALIDEEDVKDGISALTNLVNLIGSLIESIGGGKNALIAFGSIATQVFSSTIASEINKAIINFQNVKNNLQIKNDDIANTQALMQTEGYKKNIITELINAKREAQKYYDYMSQAQINQHNQLLTNIADAKQQLIITKERTDAAERFAKSYMASKTAKGNSFKGNSQIERLLSEDFQEISGSSLLTIQALQDKINDFSFKVPQEGLKELKNTYQDLVSDIGKKPIQSLNSFENYKTALNQIKDSANPTETEVRRVKRALTDLLKQANTKVTDAGALRSLMDQTDALQKKLSFAEKAQRKYLENIQQFSTIKTFVNMVAGLGQIAAGLTNIVNLTKIWKDTNLSSGEKILQTFTNLSMTLPMLVNGFTKTKEGFTLLLGKIVNMTAAQGAYTGATVGSILANQGLAAALQTVATNFYLAYGFLLPYIAAIGAITAVVYGLYKAYNSAADAAETASKSAVQAKERYDALRDSFKNLMSSIEDYSNAKSALDDLVEGTSEWYDQVNLLNDKVLQLLQTFPELAKYVHLGENGVLTIDEEGIEESQKIYRQRAYAAGMANAVQQERSYQANKTAQITEEGRRIYGVGGMLGGYGTLEKVLNAIESQGQGILGDEKVLEKLGLNEDQIIATQEKADSIRQLSNALKSEEIQVNALKDSVIKSTLAAEKQYQQADNKQVFSDLYASAMEQASTQLDNKYYTETLQGDQGGLYTVRELDKKALAVAYSNYSGRQTKVDSSGKFQEKIGNQWKDITTENVQNYVAAAEANAHATELLTEATKRYNQAEEKLSEEEKQILFNNNFARGLDKVDIRNLTSQDIETLKNSSNTEEIANFLGVDPSKFNEELNKLNEQIQNGLTGFINNIQEDSIKQTLEKIHSEGGLSQAIAEQIAQDIKSTQTKVGKGAGQIVSDFYDKVFDKDNLESGTNFISAFDFATGSLIDFKNGLSEAGVDVEKFADEIKEYYNAQIKRRNIEFEQNRVDPEKVANGSATMGLLQKQASGENLSKQELEDLETGIKGLLQLYPELTKEIQLLDKTEMIGTQAYIEALRKLKIAFVSSYSDMLKAGTIQQEDIANQMDSYIQSSEDLQMVIDTNLYIQSQYIEKLKSLASGYESCKGQLEAYTLAQQTNNEQTLKSSEYNLRLSLRSAENAEKYGIQAQRISDLAKQYAELAKQGQVAYQGLDENAELATDVAIQYIRLNDSIEDLQKNFTSVSEVLDTLSSVGLEEVLGDEDLFKTFEKIKEDVAGILNVSSELVDANFIKEYAEQIKEAANGSEEAVEFLQDAFSKNLIANIQIDDEKFYDVLNQTKEDYAEWLDSLPVGEIDLDQNPAIQSLVTLLEEAGYTQQQIEQLFKAANIELDLGYPDTSGIENAAQDILNVMTQATAKAGMAAIENLGLSAETTADTRTDTDSVQNPGYNVEMRPVSGEMVLPALQGMSTSLGVIPQFAGTITRPISYPEAVVTPVVEPQEVSKETTAVGLKVKGAHKTAGGQISHKNKSGGNKKSSGGGKKGGGGGSSKAKTPKTAKGVTAKVDPYRTVNNALKRTGSDLEKVRKEQEKLAGKDLIDNLTKQQKILDEQVELYKEKLAIAKQERDTIASTLQQQGIGLQFDQNGTISNMEQALEQAAAKANAEIARYNRMSAEQQEKDANKNIAKNAETWFKNIQTLLSNYDKLTEDTIPDLEKTIADQLAKQLELNLEKFNLQVDLTLDAGQASRQYNEFKKQVIDKIADDDILGIDRYLQEDIKLYQAENQALDKHIEEIRERISNMQNGLFDSVYGNNINQAFEDLAKYTDKAVDNLKDIEDKIKDIRESVFDAIDKVEQAFDEQKEEYDYISDLIDHSRKLTEIRYGDDAYDLMEQLYERERENNNSLLEFQYGQTQLWYQKMLEARQNMNNATDEQDKKHWEKQFKEYEKLYIDSQNELNSKFEESIENIIDKYVNAINKVFDELEKRMTNGLGLGYLADEWDLINEGTDRYLDKVDALYEIDALDNAYQEAIKNAEGNSQAQKSLNELMNTQLKYLRDKDKLTKYDVDRANALLDIEVKRLALENSRNNKSKLRLRRDSQGNYTYQYTADDSDVNKAEQDLAKARKDLYDMTRDSYKDNLEDFQSTLTQMENDIKDVMADATLSEEQRWKKAKMLAQNYAPQIKDILSNLEVTKGFLPNDMIDSLSASLHEAIQLSDDDAETLLHTIVPQMTSTLADAAKYVRDQGIEGLVNDMFEGYNLASEQLRKEMEQAERYVNQDLSELIKQTDAAILVAKDLLENNARLIADNQDFINRVNQQIAQGVQEAMAATNTSLADTTLSALDAATAFDRLNASLQAAIMTLDPDYYNINTNKASSRDVNNVNKSVNDTLNSGMEIASGATGMYTGSWGSEGRLAILHEKELLLNKDDTKNMLSAINIVRTMDDLLNNIDFNSKILNSSIAIGSGANQSSAVDQNIHIEANFPNVSMRGEIEKAFEGLVNQAYQYAFNTKK